LLGIGFLLPYLFRNINFDRPHPDAICYDFGRGRIDRETARELLLKTRMKSHTIDHRLDLAEQQQIVERYIDGDLEADEVKRRLSETGIPRIALTNTMNSRIEEAIIVRYTKHEIGRAEARKLLTELSHTSYAKTVQILDGIDRIMAERQG
jgi:hypothetical protein